MDTLFENSATQSHAIRHWQADRYYGRCRHRELRRFIEASNVGWPLAGRPAIICQLLILRQVGASGRVVPSICGGPMPPDNGRVIPIRRRIGA